MTQIVLNLKGVGPIKEDRTEGLLVIEKSTTIRGENLKIKVNIKRQDRKYELGKFFRMQTLKGKVVCYRTCLIRVNEILYTLSLQN